MSDIRIQLERGIEELFNLIAVWRGNPEHPDSIRNLIGALKVAEMMALEELIRVVVNHEQRESLTDAIGSALREARRQGVDGLN